MFKVIKVVSFLLLRLGSVPSALTVFSFFTNPTFLFSEQIESDQEESRSNIMITMNQPMTPIIQMFSQMSFLSRDAHVTAMVASLRTASVSSQVPVMEVLEAHNVKGEPFWLTNQIYVQGANSTLLEALRELTPVKVIDEEKIVQLIPPINVSTGTPPNDTLWNVRKIGVERLWELGVKGEGVLIAGIDTGARATHVTLRNNFVGKEQNGWYDAIWGAETPHDVAAHGTHTMGTMVGSLGIGAAPAAKWMHCKACALAGCPQHALLACCQFVLCPSGHNETQPNCTNIPHIVNNSWGGGAGQTWLDDVLAAWKAAGILPFFANGNSGPKCETSGYPAELELVMAVGATDIEDKLANFSSRGPARRVPKQTVFSKMLNTSGNNKEQVEILKPDICAPGKDINSAGITSDYSYLVLSGTSMASPLVAGAAALLLSKNPTLNMDQLKLYMESTAERNLPPTDTPEQCGSTPETEFPNNVYGHGRLDVYEAYQMMLSMMDVPDNETQAT